MFVQVFFLKFACYLFWSVESGFFFFLSCVFEICLEKEALGIFWIFVVKGEVVGMMEWKEMCICLVVWKNYFIYLFFVQVVGWLRFGVQSVVLRVILVLWLGFDGSVYVILFCVSFRIWVFGIFGGTCSGEGSGVAFCDDQREKGLWIFGMNFLFVYVLRSVVWKSWSFLVLKIFFWYCCCVCSENVLKCCVFGFSVRNDVFCEIWGLVQVLCDFCGLKVRVLPFFVGGRKGVWGFFWNVQGGC
jgi:hypothetical protein